MDRAEELSSRMRDGGSSGRGGRGGRVRGGRRAGKAEGGGMNREVAISKALSKLLRHAAEDVGLKLDTEGYAHLDEVVSHFILLFSFNLLTAEVPSTCSLDRVTCPIDPSQVFSRDTY